MGVWWVVGRASAALYWCHHHFDAVVRVTLVVMGLAVIGHSALRSRSPAEGVILGGLGALMLLAPWYKDRTLGRWRWRRPAIR